ncbi:MAG: hypothetical protein RBS73_17810 [Prolixibacteraceae bacterium]|jgi:hypothetical protein|nr:hypothetical protein [Prolixibacteraceae bacterium]
MYRVIWEYKVKPRAVSEFEEFYGPGGEWVRFFKQSKSYMGTELLLDDESKLSYITIDFWDSEEGYELFFQENKEQYELLDEKGNAFTKSEKRIWT